VETEATLSSLTAPLPVFRPFPKIPRLSREIIITEKIDGTNASVYVSESGLVLAGKRSGWITPENDNAGFAKWVRDHEEELRTGLGPGLHFGEWWGSGIQRRYGLNEKRFSLFNVGRWNEITKPACCDVVPLLYRGDFSEVAILESLLTLKNEGSLAAPGFMQPEGIVIFHIAAGVSFKKTLEGDEKPKNGKES
jgi:hypothetical protein